MNNPKIEVDLAELLNKLDSKLDTSLTKLDNKIDKYQNEIKEEFKATNARLEKIDGKVDNIDKRLAIVETNQGNMKEQISKIENTQKNQIWALIGLLGTAVLSTLAKVLFFMPKL